MITLENLLKKGQYKIQSSDKFLWDSFGSHARFLDFDTSDHPETYVSCIFDEKNQFVYEISIGSKQGKHYRWVSPDYLNQYQSEFTKRHLHFETLDEGEPVSLLDQEEDILRKVEQLIQTGTCDDDVTIQLDLDDDLLEKINVLAEKEGLTPEKYVENILNEKARKILENLEKKEQNLTEKKNPKLS